ncbi:Transcriptional regulatory protein WalR [Patescibacteria group bacterium]|nr:Transcriptional regulatory protein WalR [Patescibacteria group bacterium]
MNTINRKPTLNRQHQQDNLVHGSVAPNVPFLFSHDIRVKKILVVDDSVVVRKVIVRALVAENYQVFEAKDADEAFNILETQRLDLVLLDIILRGDKDGYDILADIRQRPSLIGLPVIMLTSRDGLFDKLKGNLSQVNKYLTKPFKPDELLAVIKDYL